MTTHPNLHNLSTGVFENNLYTSSSSLSANTECSKYSHSKNTPSGDKNPNILPPTAY